LLADAAEHAAATLGAQCHLEIEPGEPVLVNDDRLTEIAEAVARTLVGEDAVHRQQQPSTGSEDFAFYLERVPGSQISLGTSNPARGINSGLHTPTFDIDEAALPVGAALLAGVALKAAEVA
jgi:metal-dependent amidase/aminoacylase/carboxypeptidase family protein